MKVLVEGHRYSLPLYNDETKEAEIQFIHNECINQTTGELREISDGITDEQLLEILVDRCKYHNNKLYCSENEQVLIALQTALFWKQKRKLDRISRNVVGKLIP